MSTIEQPQSDVDTLLAAFRHMTLIELAEFVKRFEEEFDVSAAVFAAPAVAASVEAEAAPEESDEFTVTVTAVGAAKIQVIKLVREARKDLGLKEAKELVESTPAAVLVGVDSLAATVLADKLRDAGATVEVAATV